MKIKDILHANVLRYWLIALALVPAIVASAATHTPTNPQPSSGSVSDNLKAITELSFSANDLESGKCLGTTYYDYDAVEGKSTWYKYGGERPVADENGNGWLDWKIAHAIGFKLAPGTYDITVNFRNGNISKGAALWIHGVDSYVNTYDSTQGETIVGTNSYEDHTIQVTLDTPQIFWVSATDGNTVRFHAIKVERIEAPTAPDLKAITSPYFWYYNGGERFSNDTPYGPYGPDGTYRHYRHLPGGSILASNLTVIVNGEEVGGDNKGALSQTNNGSYVFKQGDAIGVKLDGNKDYRIKVYLRDRDGGSDSPDKNKVLYKGINVETATLVDNPSQVKINVVDNDGSPTNTDTRLMTYEIDKADAGVYWIKNTLDDDLYIGGFEVLPKDYPSISGTFKANSWYADVKPQSQAAAMSDTQIVSYAASGDNVVVYGPAMALNATTINGHKAMTINNGNKIGFSLMAGDILKFTFIADGNTKVPITDDNGNVLQNYSGANGRMEVTYTSPSAQKIWITGGSPKYAYLAGFEVEHSGSGYETLQPTNSNYIYKVDGVPSTAKGGVQNTGDCDGRVMFVDQNASAWIDSNSKMNILGTVVSPVVIENGTDFFAVKVDKNSTGVKTGYVKVYFNGGNSGSHIMEELPLEDPMNSGWNSSYDPAAHVITFASNGGGRGWWFGNDGSGARDLSKYNKINIQLGAISGNPSLQLVVQSTNGALAKFPADLANGRILGDLTDQSCWEPGNNGAKFDITKISQIYIQDNNVDNSTATVEITSARLMNKPVVIATDTDQDPANGFTEVFGGKIYNLADGYVYEYPFNLDKATSVPQFIWITGAGAGTLNIAAVEVLYDTNHAKVVEWYVNKDTKMIVGSDDPAFTMEFEGKTLTYPEGYDEYVTFYMSAERQANVSFIMPEAEREVYDWQTALKKTSFSVNDSEYVIENDALKASYGKHTIIPSELKDYNPAGVKMNIEKGLYDRDQGQKEGMNGITGKLYSWYTYSYDFPSSGENTNYWAGVKITATQKVDGKDETETVGGKLGEWNIFMRFVAYKAPVASNSNNNVTVTAGQKGDIYYTVDSSEPDNLGAMSAEDGRHSATEKYSGGVDVSKMNCIFKAAQYVKTDFYFYEDISRGRESATSNVLKVVSGDLPIINEDPSVVYVRDKELDGEELFNVQDGGYMLTIPTGRVSDSQAGWVGEFYTDKDGKYLKKDGKTTTNKSEAVAKYYDQPYNPTPFMYLTLGGKDRPYWGGSGFNLCGTNWKASNDGGLHTFLDSYQFKFDVDGVKNISPWKTSDTQNQNPYTECNGGPGGTDTENGGMFLQPISGTMLRFEPEYDGVITVWLRQNGCLDNNTQESGTFARRPVFVMDENGRIMRRSTVRPTAAHYMGINGVWAINSSVCEQRSQVEHTWLYEVAKQVYEDHPLYAGRFGSDFPNRWEEDGLDHSGHILYGWWYKGFDLNATRSKITSAAHVSRYEYMEPELLYRSDKIYDMEMNRLGLKSSFAKYGFELPNFQYVRYRIPVKAGKTYYIAGRGTKNGFSAIRFDALTPNTNHLGMDDLRYTDNPEVVENPDQSSADYLKVTSNWSNNGSHDYKGSYVSSHDLTGKSVDQVLAAYNNLETLKIGENEVTNTAAINSHVYENGKVYGMDNLGNLAGKTVDVELTRTFKPYNWHPIILPFSLSETRVEQYFGKGTVVLYLDPYAHTMDNQLDETTGKSWTSVVSEALEGTKLSFTIHRYQMLYANTPAFICPTFEWPSDMKDKDAAAEVKKNIEMSADGKSISKITFRRVTVDGSNSRNFLSEGYIGYAISNDYEVVGSYDRTEHNGDIYYVNNTDANAGKDNMAQLVHSENKTVTMKGTRVWIRPRAGAVNPAPIKTVASRGFSDFEEDSGNSGIADVVSDDYTIEGYDIDDDGVYDLLGRKVAQGSLDGVVKGVYIFHGRKVYVK